MRAAADGFIWPDLLLLPHGHSTYVKWQSDKHPRNSSPVRYIASGDAFTDTTSTRVSLAAMVESVLGRLEESGIRDTPLNEEWQAINSADTEEREFCEAAALLGLDPYDLEPETVTVLLEVAERLDGHLRGLRSICG